MAAGTAPFHGGMRLGQGFNSYTQELRLDEAVIIPPSARVSVVNGSAPAARPQSPEPKIFADSVVKAAVDRDSGTTDRASSSTPKSSEPGKHEVLKAGDNEIVGIVTAELPSVADPKDSANAKLGSKTHDTILEQVQSEYMGPRYVLPALHDGQEPNSNQSVTFSTRAISNMSDVMDALNISASTSIKYGTIHGNGSASFVNEDKILESQLNYLVSVKVNNNDTEEPTSMAFNPIDGITPDKFTEVYGDCFIAGFQTGGEFNAIISVDCHDKSKAHAVREAIDLQLAVPPVPGLSVAAAQSVAKNSTELFRGIEMTISVNWTGGGELKPPDVPWDLKTVIAAANAYPSMVARSAARISAILRPYTSLSSFVKWQYAQRKAWNEQLDKFDQLNTAPLDEGQKKARKTLEDEGALWTDKTLILNYAPCQLYTNDLFNAYMQFKSLWKRISFIMSDTSKWRVQKREDILRAIGTTDRFDPFDVNPRPTGPERSNTRPSVNTQVGTQVKVAGPSKEGQVTNGLSATTSTPGSTTTTDWAQKTAPPTPHVGSLSRFETFPLQDPSIKPEWNLDQLNAKKDPISLDVVELNEARLICREAMTLITEEAYSLVYHPDLAYAEYIKEKKTTKMKRPIYMYPEVLKARLPIFIRNDAVLTRRSRDPVIMKLKQFDNGDLWANILGDDLNQKWSYRSFCSLERNESNDNPQLNNTLLGMSVHAYVHSVRYHFLPQWWQDSHRAIGGFGFKFENDHASPAEDECTQWEGEYQSHDNNMFRKLMFRNIIKNMKEDESHQLPPRKDDDGHMHRPSWMPGSSSHSIKPDASLMGKPKTPDVFKAASEHRDITKIDVYYAPGTGRIAGLVFYDVMGETQLSWKQWEGAKPDSVKRFENYPSRDGTKWKFVGIMGDWTTDVMGNNKVLSRFSGIWRKA